MCSIIFGTSNTKYIWLQSQGIARCVYDTSNSRECMGVNGETLKLHTVYKNFLLQIMWEFVSGTTSDGRCIWTRNEIKGSYDEIIITIVPSYTRKDITRLLPLALLLVLHTCNITDGNKLMMFSGIHTLVQERIRAAWVRACNSNRSQ